MKTLVGLCLLASMAAHENTQGRAGQNQTFLGLECCRGICEIIRIIVSFAMVLIVLVMPEN